jgi:hypothetical protein
MEIAEAMMKASLNFIAAGFQLTILSSMAANAMENYTQINDKNHIASMAADTIKDDALRQRDPFLPPQNCSVIASEHSTLLGRWRLLGLIGENGKIKGWFSNDSRWFALQQGDRFYQTPFTVSSFESNAAILQLDEQNSYRCGSAKTVRLAFTARLKQHKEQYEINY